MCQLLEKISIEYIKFCTFLENLATLNIQNYVHSLKKLFTLNFNSSIVTFLEKILHWIYWIVYLVWKFVHVKYTEIWHSYKNCVHWIYNFVYIFEKLCILNIHNFLPSSKNCVIWKHKIVYFLQIIVYVSWKFEIFFEGLDIHSIDLTL